MTELVLSIIVTAGVIWLAYDNRKLDKRRREALARNAELRAANLRLRAEKHDLIDAINNTPEPHPVAAALDVVSRIGHRVGRLL